MAKHLLVLFASLVAVGALRAADAEKAVETVTAEQLNESPEKFVDKTIVLDHMQLRGEVLTGPAGFKLAVKSSKGTEFKPDQTDSQKIRFRTPDKSEQASAFFKSLQAGATYSVRLTCEVKKLRETVALVRRIDLIRYEEASKQGDVVSGVSVEEVAKKPGKYAGNTLAFDRVEFTGDSAHHKKERRFAFAVKTPAATLYGVNLTNQQTISFTATDKGTDTKTYIQTKLKEDKGHPVRLVCEILAVGNGHIASIKRIDLIAFDYDDDRKTKAESNQDDVKPAGTKLVTIEDVYESPELYNGKVLVFKNAKLGKELVKRKSEFYWLNVTSQAGKTVPAAPTDTGFAFNTTPTVADKLKNTPELGDENPVTLYSRIRKSPAGQWVAAVGRVDFCSKDGTVRKTVDSTPPGEDAFGITGRWGGPRKNEVQGSLGDDWLFVREQRDGNLTGEWWGMSIKNGIRVDKQLLTWEADGSAFNNDPIRYRVRCKVGDEGKTLHIDYTVFYSQNGKERSYGGSSVMAKQ